MKIGGAVALAALAIGAAAVLPLSIWVGWLVEWVRAAGATGAIVYALVYVLATVCMIPGSILTVGVGVAYGPIWGTLFVSPVSVLAAAVPFALGRTLARGWVAGWTASDPRFRAVDVAVGEHGFKIVVLMRLSPLVPFNVLNYAFGLTDVKLRDYVLGSFVGMLPGALLYVYIGSMIGEVAALSRGEEAVGTARQLLSAAGLVATIVVTVFITRLARRALSTKLSERPAVALQTERR
jgi:uncharacterized membrane protein YdjX (TVP38/TMEM64 family)